MQECARLRWRNTSRAVILWSTNAQLIRLLSVSGKTTASIPRSPVACNNLLTLDHRRKARLDEDTRADLFLTEFAISTTRKSVSGCFLTVATEFPVSFASELACRTHSRSKAPPLVRRGHSAAGYSSACAD